MQSTRFDAIAQVFAGGKRSRRAALAAGAAVLAAGANPASARESTPPAWNGEKINYLFVQSFQSGGITPKDGAADTFTLTLEQGLGQTIFFSDRPERIVGSTPTDEFLTGLGFAVDNPPNAALVVASPDGTTDIAVVELTNPVFDPASPGVTYDVTVLAEWQKEIGVGFHEVPADLSSLPATFGAASLFIDDCPDSDVWCRSTPAEPGQYDTTVGVVATNVPMCWNYSECQPCEPYGHNLPDFCANIAYWKERCTKAFGSQCNEKGCWPNWNWTMPRCFY